MLYYYKDTHGTLHCVAGELNITDQKQARSDVRSVTGITTEERINESKVPICELDYMFDGPVEKDQLASARLIPAAPELLNACIELLDHAVLWQGEPDEFSCPIHASRVRQARQALAKATGGEG